MTWYGNLISCYKVDNSCCEVNSRGEIDSYLSEQQHTDIQEPTVPNESSLSIRSLKIS